MKDFDFNWGYRWIFQYHLPTNCTYVTDRYILGVLVVPNAIIPHQDAAVARHAMI